jgi:hypothetical protein
MSTLPTIFVNIPAYRDSETYHTVQDIFERAKYPNNVHVGICWQYNSFREEPFQLRDRKHQVSVINLDYRRARGCSWARSIAQTLYGGEDYFLHIDAHSRLIPNWDAIMIDELARCQSDKPILSTYPNHYTLPNNIIDHGPYKLVYNVCHNRIPLFHSRACEEHEKVSPSISLIASGGFVFGRGQTIIDVPHDPHIYFIGEEVGMSVRYWTHGYDMFTPTRTMVFHLYTTPELDKNFHWKDYPDWHTNYETNSLKRMLHLLDIETTDDPVALRDFDRYGLGKIRSLKEYEAFAGVDFAGQTFSENAKKGIPSL